MKKERAMELLWNIVKCVSIANDAEKQIEELTGYGFTPDELVNDFKYSAEDVEKVTGETVSKKITVSVYRDTADPGFKIGDRDNYAELEIDRDELLKYFDKWVMANRCQKEIDLEAEFEKFLENYTCDDMDGLYEFIGGKASGTFRDYLVSLYNKKWNALHEEAVSNGADDPDYVANYLFDNEADADEIAGYYISHYGNDALKTWQKNLETAEDRAKYKEQDAEISRILGNLYGVSCKESGTEDNERSFTFRNGEELFNVLRRGISLYNPLLKFYLCARDNNDSPAIVYDDITPNKAKTLSQAMADNGYTEWSEMLANGNVIGIPEAWNENATAAGWVRADEYTFSEENQKYISKYLWNNNTFIDFNVEVVIGGRPLLDMAMHGYKLDITDYAKNVYRTTPCYSEEICEQMKKMNIHTWYIDSFNCAVPNEIFEKYCTVFEDDVRYDYEASAARSDRSDNVFSVPCQFDLERYIIDMIKG